MVEEKTVLLLDDNHGVYIPKLFAERQLIHGHWEGVSSEDIEVLQAGPEHEHYWEAWDDVIDHATFTDPQGEVWRLWQDGALFAYTGEGEQWV